jgi:photosystem II stability/assembly factor-like uncharacterized protein
VRGSRVLAMSAVAFALALIPAANAAAASIWTPVASGTGGTISAIATPKAGEVVFTTTAGKIFHSTVGGAFAEASLNLPMALAFDDVAMSPDGTVGIAVGEAGSIYRSGDSGANWNRVNGTTAWTGECGGGSNSVLAENLFSVHFASASVIYVTGANDDVLKSVNGGTTFSEVNKDSSSCLIHSSIGDSAWREPNVGYLVSNYFGALWRTTDGFGGGVGGTTQIGSSVNGFEGRDRLALDADDPLRMWATNPGLGTSYFRYSVNGGVNWESPTLTDGATKTSFLDLASGIGTNVVAVGAGGAIYTTTNGVNFVPQPADAPNAANTWEAVAFQPGSATAWVGGTNGVLLTTAQANFEPQEPSSPPPSGATTAPPAPVLPGPGKPKVPVKCTVPKLTGKSLKSAARKLKAAHCALGKVTKKEGATVKDGEVAKESAKPGKTLPAGTKIKVTLAP